ncbi:hypothetical protein M3Y98_00732600 [Aphelenchoides besseyi]|nr:hypothetical protein M3Y98_00732600 [Aphelenchoides besseyi]KAI6211387.1 hypothetical protein M3Y96_00428900 [Aphelenchoides besseyi]
MPVSCQILPIFSYIFVVGTLTFVVSTYENLRPNYGADAAILVSAPIIQRRSYAFQWHNDMDSFAKPEWQNYDWTSGNQWYQDQSNGRNGQLSSPSLLSRHWLQKRGAMRRERILDALGGDYLI